MLRSLPDKDEILDAIRHTAQVLGHPPSRAEFKAHSRMSEYQVLLHFPSWREALRAAGLECDSTNIQLDNIDLLRDWGTIVRRNRQIPTRVQYRKQGKYSSGVFDRHFGPWSLIPTIFRKYFSNNPEWADVITLLPIAVPKLASSDREGIQKNVSAERITDSFNKKQKNVKFENRPTYGNPIDFRGLRHEPVNEQGVVFLFGMVARELGYMVESLQAGFPDCEAKRQVEPGKWQRARIEFEFESRNFRDHGHSPDCCDVIVCWIHNWSECPPNLEVLELSNVIKSLAKSDE